MMPAAKHFDPVLGIDIHIIQPPGPVPPVPIPHPFIGFIIDPFDYAPIIGSTVKINYMHRALAGTAGKCLPPHIPIGGVFVKPPANECEMFMGSATVCIDGDAQSYLALPALSCHDVGMIPPPRVNPKKKSKVRSMVLPTSVVLPIPAGPPVLIGGPPTISLMALGMRVGMAALGKAFKKLSKTKKFRKFKKKIKSKFKSKRKPGHHKSCGRPGEPIDVSNGANVDDFLDHEILGEIPIRWKRYYDSTLCGSDGPLGRGFRHEYERELRRTATGFEYLTAEGELVEFDPLSNEQPQTASDGILLSRAKNGAYWLAEAGQPTMEFRFVNGKNSAPLASLFTKKGRLTFDYDTDDRLASIRGTRDELLTLHYDATNHIRQVTLAAQKGPRTIASYEFDDQGRMIRWTDPLGNASQYAYDANSRMRKKTDRNGYSFRYRYDADGRCVHTWGDDGLYDVRFDYFPEASLTVATYGDGAVFTYILDEQGALAEIIDPVGGSTRFTLDDAGQVVAEIDPAGNETKFLYDGWGGHTGRLAPTGHRLPPMHVQPQQPDVLAYELPQTPAEWEFGSLLKDRVTEEISAGDPVLTSFPAPAARKFIESPAAHSNAAPIETFDLSGRLIERVDHRGRRERWQYDRNGNLIAYHDPDGSIHSRRIASWNLTRQAVDPLGNESTFEYSIREHITRAVDAGGTESEYQYDGCDRLIQVRRNGQLREQYEYDVGGNLVRKSDHSQRELLSFKPGPFGNPAECSLASGGKLQFQYDAAGRPVQAKSPVADVALKYDWTGHVASDLRDKLGVQHEVAPSKERVTTVLKKFLIQQRVVGNGEFEVEDPTGAIHQFRQSPAGLMSRQLSNGTSELTQFDADGRCHAKISIHKKRPESLWVRRYEYSAAGDLLAIEDSQRATTRYTYDAAHRLNSQVLPDHSSNQFVFDRANNLLAQPGLSGVQVANGNRLQRANGVEYQYNERQHVAQQTTAAGERTDYSYDSLDFLVEIKRPGGNWTAAYDPLGRRIKKTWPGHVVDFYWDDDRLAAEVLDGKRLRIYVYANISSWVPFMFAEYDSLDAEPESGRRYFIFTNQIGAPERVEDDEGQVVWQATIAPFGSAQVDRGGSIDFALRFPGHYEDQETGLFYNRFRYYDPSLGRYLQSDPLGIAGGINVYAYPANPLTNVDLQGLHGKSHSKGQGKRKGSAKAESTNMRHAGDAKPDPKKLSGMTDEAFAATARIAAKNDVKIRMRPSNPDCLDLIKKGHPKKPEFIKNKTINQMDELMGPPPAPGTKGMVGHFEPPPRDAAVARAEQKLGRPLSDAEKEALEKRRAQRMAEFHNEDPTLRHEKGDKVTIDDNRGVLTDNRPGDTQGKEFTGDHDMFDIQKKGPDGEFHPADAKTKENVVNDMKNDPNVQAQHGDHRSWEPETKKDKDIDQKILKGHQEGGEPLVDFNPDGGIGTSHFEP
jgi:RHS repeat-associated protein